MTEQDIERVVIKTVVIKTVERLIEDFAYSASIDGIATRVIKVSDLLELIEEEESEDAR